ncbi:unnamed protein product [Euphydryas editha]|uniref:Uncharacterized protein n=1 Tax=Euphydryas editha TaxID=104508 RepID=A0AAU9U967_EUPED|nr:unnamed protein product [Euphydryas editha]
MIGLDHHIDKTVDKFIIRVSDSDSYSSESDSSESESETIHPTISEKSHDFFHRKLQNLPKTKNLFTQQASVPNNAMLVSIIVLWHTGWPNVKTSYYCRRAYSTSCSRHGEYYGGKIGWKINF